MVDVQTIGVLVTAASVSVAAIYYIMTLRVQQRNMKANLDTRQAQILMSLYQKWSEPEFQEAWFDIQEWEWRDYDDWQTKYGRRSNPEEYRKMMVMGSFLEGLGVFVKRGLIDAVLVDDLMSLYIVRFWQKMGPILKEVRVRMSSPTTAEYTEYLFDVVYEIWRRQHPETPKPWTA